MKKFFTIFFVVLGVIFFCLLLAAAYVWVADPFGLRSSNESMIETVKSEVVPPEEGATAEVSATPNQNQNLTPEQENALRFIGIDPMALPEEITPEQQACFERTLGVDRVAEIKAGDAPSAIEIFKAKECL